MRKNRENNIKRTVIAVIVFFLMATAVPFRAYALSLPVRYSDKSVKLTIKKKRYYGTTCYVARLKLKKKAYRRFKGGVSKYRKGETTRHFAKRVKALFAVSGDYSLPNGYTCVRKGVVYKGKSADVPAVYNANTGMLMEPGSLLDGRSLSQLAKSGDVYNTFNFGPAFLRNGKILLKKDRKQKKGNGRPRVFVGTSGKPGDICFVVTEGADSSGGCRSDGRSYGLTGWQCAKVLKKLGCRFGVPLDGGGSTQMIYRGQAVNRVNKISFTESGKAKTRKIYDFFYLSRK